jgi:CRISPR/Cas system-associated exonuclease Cas4 (RecB family)
MAHDVLLKAGRLRDESRDGVIENGEYRTVIPSEVLYGELKQEFNITNWQQYFTPIIKQTARYESDLVEELLENQTDDISIDREIKLQLTVEQLENIGIMGIKQPIVGVVDLLIHSKTHAIIIDYKFSSNKKTQDDFDMNSQLLLYALLVHVNYDVPLHNIKYGYIDIPKQMFGTPALLSNGTISRSKSQNVSQEMYEKSVIAVHGDDSYYNCKPGGYYYECWCNLALNRSAYLSVQWLDFEAYEGILHDLMNAAYMIDYMIEKNLPFLKKYDSYSCKGCEYLTACKKWLTV